MDNVLPSHNAFREAVKRAGGQVPFGEMVGCSQSNISRLLSRQAKLPGRYVLKAEAGTGVSRHDLRPDLYPREQRWHGVDCGSEVIHG